MRSERAALLAGMALVGACAMPWAGEPARDLPLAGTRWVGVAEGIADVKSRPRLEFTSNGRMAGFTGCNNMSSSYEESRGAATFGPVAATKRFCAGIEGEIEKRVLEAVALSGVARRSEGRLMVTGPAGARFDFLPN